MRVVSLGVFSDQTFHSGLQAPIEGCQVIGAVADPFINESGKRGRTKASDTVKLNIETREAGNNGTDNTANFIHNFVLAFTQKNQCDMKMLRNHPSHTLPNLTKDGS